MKKEKNWISQVEAFLPLLRKIFPETPLQKNRRLSEHYGAEIYLKREDLTPVRSYKLRGAFRFFSEHPEEERFVCASAGNHAQGFAFACAHFKRKGVIFMPVTTPAQKVHRTRFFGKDFVEIRLEGDTFDEAASAAKVYCKAQKALFVPPFDHETIIKGQATVAAEIISQLPEVDIILVPVGGGGLISGVLSYLAEKAPETEIYAVEPKEAPALFTALQKGEPVAITDFSTFVDGAAVARVGHVTFSIIHRLLKHPVELVPENRVCSTILDFLNQEGIVLEPAGALALDALKNLPPKMLEGKKVVCIASGGNFDFERLPEVKERSMQYEGLKKYFLLRLPQRPGALREFLQLLGPDDDIARFEYLKKSARNFGTVLLGIETTHPDNFLRLKERMKAAGLPFQDVTEDPMLSSFLI